MSVIGIVIQILSTCFICSVFCFLNLFLFRGNWGNYGNYFCLGEHSTEDWAIFNFSKTPIESTYFENYVIDSTIVQENPARLRAALAPSLGLWKSNLLIKVMENENYVLTPDFALKILILNERRKAGASVIIEGDTGVGKVFSYYFFLPLTPSL